MRKALRILFLTFVSSLLLFSCEGEIEGTAVKGTVEGTVTLENGEDICLDKIFIYAENTEDKSVAFYTMADKEGHYSLNLEEGEYNVRYDIPEVDTVYRTYKVISGEITKGNVTVDASFGKLYGKVELIEYLDIPFEELTVHISGMQDGKNIEYSTSVSKGGTYSISCPAPVTYSVEILHEGKILISGIVPLKKRGKLNQDFFVWIDKNVYGTLAVQGATDITEYRINLIDPSTGVSRESYITENGKWSFPNVDYGDYLLVINDPRLKSVTESVHVGDMPVKCDIATSVVESNERATLKGHTVYEMSVDVPVYWGFTVPLIENGNKVMDIDASAALNPVEREYDEETLVEIGIPSERGTGLTCRIEVETEKDLMGKTTNRVVLHIDRYIDNPAFLSLYFKYDDTAEPEYPSYMLFDHDYGFTGDKEFSVLNYYPGILVSRLYMKKLLKIAPGTISIAENFCKELKGYPFFKFVDDELKLGSGKITYSTVINKGFLLNVMFPEEVKGTVTVVMSPDNYIDRYKFRVDELTTFVELGWVKSGNYQLRFEGTDKDENSIIYVSKLVWIGPGYDPTIKFNPNDI